MLIYLLERYQAFIVDKTSLQLRILVDQPYFDSHIMRTWRKRESGHFV